MRKKAILLMPLTHNDGQAIPQAVLDDVYAQLFELCGGLTVVGKVHGSFRMADGSRQEDILEQVWLAVEETDLPALRKLVASFGRTLHQERMYFEVTEARVELLPPLPEEGFEHEQDDRTPETS
jgi:hypothetical protein